MRLLKNPVFLHLNHIFLDKSQKKRLENKTKRAVLEECSDVTLQARVVAGCQVSVVQYTRQPLSRDLATHPSLA